ncbi:1-phosphatidylinositol 4,5-bisphosphate phosphodiesterase eta-1-like, partial [Brachionichthys hirsutus]|uniref:1-phosphatidylinositol 4,5-bisphosphate phosphodiesterase eta-1-like n=1 Tax=Brachionichthys hirsutus TaxID=412623 RepID=UPI003604EF64
GKRLPAYLSADAEEGEVSDDDSADEIEDDFKFKSSNGNGHHQVESHIRKKLDSLIKESRIGDKEDSDSFSIRALLRATHQGLQKNLRQNSRGVLKKSQSRSFITTLKQKRHSKSRLTCQSVDKEEDDLEKSGKEAGGQFNRGGRKRKTMKLSRDLSNLVVFTNSVASQECLNEGTLVDVLSFSETRAQSLVSHRAEPFQAFNQRQLSRIYPSAYRIDSSNFNPQYYWNVGCQLVALNYQTEGRMMQLNRAKFMVNGGIGYVLKPPPMCKGSFNPFSDDPLPAYPKKQLSLKIISGQQLPKPPDSMLGDRGEIIDPFVEVEIIGLPVDCCKEQTRVVDDNGFNPVWEETLSFTLHMAEVVLVRFLVWDHDPIGRDFIGQRTVSFSSLMPGYRHVYLEGLTEASIFVHVSVHDVYGKWSPLVLNPSFTIMHFLGSNKGQQLRGIRGFFNRSSKSSVDTNSSGLQKRSTSVQLLRRTASAPAKGRKKTKMALSESVASISDQRNDADAGTGGDGMSGKEQRVEKHLQPRAPLTHRPNSMPLDRLLQGQLSLCSPDKKQLGMDANTVIGAYPFSRPRSSSFDPFIKSSFCTEPNLSTPSKKYINRNKETDQSEETSYLVIGGGREVSKEEDHANSQSENNEVNKLKIVSTKTGNCYISPSTNGQMRPVKPETPSNSTKFTNAPSASSSSWAPSSTGPLSPANMDCDLKSPCSLHDSTISRLIDAVSSSNEQDTCGSVSALISQFEVTTDLHEFTFLSHDHTPFRQSHLNSTTSEALQDSCTSHKTKTASSNKGDPISPQKVVHKTNPINHEIFSKADETALPLLSGPETADSEEIYTILDEEMLLPISVYSLKKQTVQVQSNPVVNTPSNNLGSSPANADQVFVKGHNVSWADMHKWRDRSEDTEEPEESVYEEVYDPPAPVRVIEQDASKIHVGSSVSACCFHFPHDAFGVEINVDEDPSEMMLPSQRHLNQWEKIVNPTNQEAIYQNHSTPKYFQQKQPLSYCDHGQQYQSHASHEVSTNYHQVSSHPQNWNNFQPSSLLRPSNSRLRNSATSHQKSCSGLERSFEVYNNRDISRPCSQQRTYNNSQIQNTSFQGKQVREPVRSFHSGFLNSESLPAQSAGSINIYNDRGPCSSSDCNAASNHLNKAGLASQLEPSAYENTQLDYQIQSQSNNPKHSWTKKTNLNNTRHWLQSESRVLLHSNKGILPANPLLDNSAPVPCKSKSLGDLTSEDISCNFQSKYNIISRSFITPHMRTQKRIGTTGEVTFQSLACDPLTEQLRKLVSLEGEHSDKDSSQPLQLYQEAKSPPPQPQETSVGSIVPSDLEDTPPLLTRRLSSRSQSRVRHINSRARERQQDSLKSRAGVVFNSTTSTGGVVLRNKSVSQKPPANRHSTGSYIAGYFGQLEDRGLPEGACTSFPYQTLAQYGDQYFTDESVPPVDSNHAASEPEVYFLLRL